MKLAAIFLIGIVYLHTSYAEDAQCSEPIDKSAVTNLAKEAAAKVHQNPPQVSGEIYSSKVKSRSNNILNIQKWLIISSF